MSRREAGHRRTDRELGINRCDARRKGIQQRAKSGQAAIEDQAAVVA